MQLDIMAVLYNELRMTLVDLSAVLLAKYVLLIVILNNSVSALIPNGITTMLNIEILNNDLFKCFLLTVVAVNPISETIPTRLGYKFIGWANGDIRYNPGDTYKENVGVTLTAIWDKE